MYGPSYFDELFSRVPSSPILVRRERPRWNDPDENVHDGSPNYVNRVQTGLPWVENDGNTNGSENVEQNEAATEIENAPIAPIGRIHYGRDLWESWSSDSEDWRTFPENDATSENSNLAFSGEGQEQTMQLGPESEEENLKGSESSGDDTQDLGVIGDDGMYIPSVFNFDPDSFWPCPCCGKFWVAEYLLCT